jgi:pimeloyl-ACP methyl ester carboxylesterase
MDGHAGEPQSLGIRTNVLRHRPYSYQEPVTAIPETRYVSTRQGDSAYQVLGEGPIDLLLGSGIGSHLDLMWEIAARFFEGLASFSRLIMLDPRGVGLSDPAPYAALSTWEDWTEDIRTVLDVVGTQRAVIFAEREFAYTAMLFAAACPERSAALILSRPRARTLAAADYPAGMPPEAFEQFIRLFQSRWGTAEGAAVAMPSLARSRKLGLVCPDSACLQHAQAGGGASALLDAD